MLNVPSEMVLAVVDAISLPFRVMVTFQGTPALCLAMSTPKSTLSKPVSSLNLDVGDVGTPVAVDVDRAGCGRGGSGGEHSYQAQAGQADGPGGDDSVETVVLHGSSCLVVRSSERPIHSTQQDGREGLIADVCGLYGTLEDRTAAVKRLCLPGVSPDDVPANAKRRARAGR